MPTTRSLIQDCISHNPGIHFNAITRKLDIATGQTQYHLQKLSREHKIHRETICGRAHYYPPTFSEWERNAIALLRRETTREIVMLLLQSGSLPPATIADRLGLAPSTIEWHLSQLTTHDIATKKRDKTNGEHQLLVSLTNTTETYRLLREIEPRLIDKLVDRFSRLTDDLLEEYPPPPFVRALPSTELDRSLVIHTRTSTPKVRYCFLRP